MGGQALAVTGIRTASEQPLSASEESRLLEHVLAKRRITASYQPVVDLATGAVVGFEAYVQGPPKSPLSTHEALAAAARRSALSAELEWQCRVVAIQGALDAGLTARTTLFVNADPSVSGTAAPHELSGYLRIAERRLRLAFDVTEDDLCGQPVATLGFARAARRRWWGVALDGLGARPASRILLPLLEPDVVRIDQTTLRTAAASERASLAEAVRAQLRSGECVSLLQGVESDDQLELGRAIGATLAQGGRFGAAGPLEPPEATARSIRLRAVEDGEDPAGLAGLVGAAGARRTVEGDGLADAVATAEALLAGSPQPGVLLVCTGAGRPLPDGLVARLHELAGSAALAGLVSSPDAARHGEDHPLAVAAIPRGSALATGWHVVALTPAATVAISGEDHDPAKPAKGAGVAVSEDPAVALAAARLVLQPLLDAV